MKLSMTSAEISQKIKNMSIICAMLVVTIHIGFPADGGGLARLIGMVVACGIAPIAVPFFFVVSGYFLSIHFDEKGWYVRELRKRIRSLVFPYITWSVIALVISVVLSVVADVCHGRPIGTCFDSSWGHLRQMFGLDLHKAPVLAPLWYVRCLFGFVLLAPVLKILIDRWAWRWLVVGFILHIYLASHVTHLANMPFGIGFWVYGFSLRGAFYFSLGIFLRRFTIRPFSVGMDCVAALVGVVLLALSCFAVSSPLLMCIKDLVLLYSVWRIIPSKTFPAWLTDASFAVFVMHLIVIWCLMPCWKMLEVESFWSSLVTFITAVLIPIALSAIMHRWMWCRWLFGGR